MEQAHSDEMVIFGASAMPCCQWLFVFAQVMAFHHAQDA